jgi:hypothetical protein
MFNAPACVITKAVCFHYPIEMSGKGGSGFETDMRNWARKMGIMPDGNASDIIRKLVFAFYTKQIYVCGFVCY